MRCWPHLPWQHQFLHQYDRRRRQSLRIHSLPLCKNRPWPTSRTRSLERGIAVFQMLVFAKTGEHCHFYKSLNLLLLKLNRTALSTSQKKSYIKAVQCLFDQPAQTDPDWAPGAKRRFDDFAAVHINQTLTIHGTVSVIIHSQ